MRGQLKKALTKTLDLYLHDVMHCIVAKSDEILGLLHSRLVTVDTVQVY